MKHHLGPRLLFSAALFLSPVCALAQSGDSAMAQSLFDQAKALMAKGHASDACPKLEESQRLEPRSGTLINLASCYEQTGRLASAWSKYIEAATSAKAATNAEREMVARERAAALAPRVSKLVIVVDPTLREVAGLQITRDGVAIGKPAWGVALPSDPGEHRVVAKAPGYEPLQIDVKLVGEGQTRTVEVSGLALQANAATRPSGPAQPASETPVAHPEEVVNEQGLGASRVAALIVGGVGVAGVGVGAVFGLLSKSKHDEVAKLCQGSDCSTQAGVDASNAAQTYGNISTVAMIVGGVGVATGITLWVTAPRRETRHTRSARVSVGLGTLELKGSF